MINKLPPPSRFYSGNHIAKGSIGEFVTRWTRVWMEPWLPKSMGVTRSKIENCINPEALIVESSLFDNCSASPPSQAINIITSSSHRTINRFPLHPGSALHQNSISNSDGLRRKNTNITSDGDEGPCMHLIYNVGLNTHMCAKSGLNAHTVCKFRRKCTQSR